MAKINSSKLLPPSKSSAIVPYQKPSITLKSKKTFVSGGIKPIKLDRKSSAIVKQTPEENLNDIGGKLVKVEKFLGSDLTLYRKQQESERKEEEKQDFEKAEEKLEAPKPKGFNFPKFPELPKSNFLDRIKRFIFFTTLGRFLPAIIGFLPKLEGIVKTIGTIYGFAENIFGKLLDGFTSLVKFGGDLKDKTLGFITQAGLKPGQNFESEFKKLESQFNLFVDASIIAGILGADVGLAAIDEYKKWKGKNKPGGEPRRGGKPPVPRGKVPVTQGRGGQKPTGKPKVTGGKTPGWWDKLFKGPFAKLKGPLSRFAGAAVPGLGAAVGAADAKARFAAGDNIGGTLASISATLDVGTAASALTGIGLPVAGILGTISMGIDIVLLIRDILRVFKVPDKLLGFANGGRVIRRYQGGGTTPTRGGQPVKAPPRRTLKVQETKKPFKLPPTQTKPGKDVGGEDKIKILYPEPKKPMSLQQWLSKDMPGITYQGYLDNFDRSKEEKKPNPFGALIEISKEVKPIKILGDIMGAGVDLALGQVPDKKIFTSFFDNIGYLADTWMNQRMNRSISLISKEVGSFADGGYVSPSRELRGIDSNESFGEVLSKILGPMINQRINESIQHLKKEIQKKPDKEEGGPGGGPGGVDGGTGTSSISGGKFNNEINEASRISGMSAAQIAAMMKIESGFIPNNESNSGALGLMQIMPSTYRELYNKYGKKYNLEDNIINPRTNTILGSLYMRDLYNGPAGRNLETMVKMYNAGPAGNLSGTQPTNHWKKFQDAYSEFRTNETSIASSFSVQGGRIPSESNITSYRGWRGGRMHRGVDYAGSGVDNEPVSVIKPGVVNYAGWDDGGGGYIVIIDHSDGTSSYYFHFKPGSIKVKSGQRIQPGQVIGIVGTSGRSTGIHLHFEVRRGNRDLPDPHKLAPYYFRFGGNVKPTEVQKLAKKDGKEGYINHEGRFIPQTWTPEQRQRFNSQSSGTSLNRREGATSQPGRTGSELASQMMVGRTIRSVKVGRDTYTERENGIYTRNGVFITKEEFNRKVGPQPTQGNWLDRLNPFRQQPQTQPSSNIQGVIEYKGQLYFRRGNDYYEMVRNGVPTKIASTPGESRQIYDMARSLPGARVLQDSGNDRKTYDRIRRHFIKKQAGGLISPSKPTRPVPSSFASYENYRQGPLLAIQPIIIERTTPIYSSRTPSIIAFPVPVGVNNIEDKLSFSRG
jgi:murein DD-endopeptidase MepM/ murein hydrolase activator NlpD